MKYYFLGICGTAMASLAILLKQKGHKVWGTDQNVYPPMSNLLRENQIKVWEGYQEKHLDQDFDIAVIGNALSRGNPEIEAILNNRLRFASLPEIIRHEFAEPLKSIVITGTHGKTTTTALMSWILQSVNLSPTFLIGGVANNFFTSAALGNSEFFVIEGDEYDSAFFDKRPKFIHYLPQYLIINNIEFDHADIYKDINQIKEGFRKLIRTMPKNGLIVANGDDSHVRETLSSSYTPIIYFGQNQSNDWQFECKRNHIQSNTFTVMNKPNTLEEFHIPLHGEHQIYNALGVIILATHIGLSKDQIQNALNSFKGVKRRLELLGNLKNALIYDDFAHHPTAIKRTLLTLKNAYPGKEILAIFEPRTNTTVRNIFQKEITEALATADSCLILPIYRSERIPYQERLSLTLLESELKNIGINVNILTDYHSIWTYLSKILNENVVGVLLTNGNMGGEYEKIYNKIKHNYQTEL